MSDKGPSPVDRYVGARIKERRKVRKMAMRELGERLGVTHQQIDKYERGAVRISAGTLYEAGAALGVKPGWFFEGFTEA